MFVSNFYRNISKIYNEYFDYGQTEQDPTLRISGQIQARNAPEGYTYPKPPPTTSPDNPRYDTGQTQSTTTAPIDNEEPMDTKAKVSKQKISSALDRELQKAAMYGMDYCVMVLASLKKELKC